MANRFPEALVTNNMALWAMDFSTPSTPLSTSGRNVTPSPATTHRSSTQDYNQSKLARRVVQVEDPWEESVAIHQDSGGVTQVELPAGQRSKTYCKEETFNQFQRKEIKVLDWPTQSPDFTQIEHLWKDSPAAPWNLQDLKSDCLCGGMGQNPTWTLWDTEKKKWHVE